MTSRQWQLAGDAATRYEQVLVPSILGPFAEALVYWADLDTANYVVDVGCGTGAATRYVAKHVRDTTKIIGTDINMGMLRVAQSLPNGNGPAIDWRHESAYKISIGDGDVDVVFCAQTLQFLDKPEKALREMHRILNRNGAVYISLWSDIEQSPYFDRLVKTIAQHIGNDTAAGLGSAFRLSDLDQILTLMRSAGFADIETKLAEIKLDLPPLVEFVPRHIRATPMGVGFDAASEETQQTIVSEMIKHLSEYKTRDGVSIPFSSHMVRATK